MLVRGPRNLLELAVAGATFLNASDSCPVYPCLYISPPYRGCGMCLFSEETWKPTTRFQAEDNNKHIINLINICTGFTCPPREYRELRNKYCSLRWSWITCCTEAKHFHHGNRFGDVINILRTQDVKRIATCCLACSPGALEVKSDKNTRWNWIHGTLGLVKYNPLDRTVSLMPWQDTRSVGWNRFRITVRF